MKKIILLNLFFISPIFSMEFAPQNPDVYNDYNNAANLILTWKNEGIFPACILFEKTKFSKIYITVFEQILHSGKFEQSKKSCESLLALFENSNHKCKAEIIEFLSKFLIPHNPTENPVPTPEKVKKAISSNTIISED